MKTIMSKRAIAFIMVCTLLMQCVGIPTSLAAGGMSVFVTMDNYVAGEKITVMWYTDVDGADHYDCTVLNQTTGAYPRPRSTSSSGYDCYISGSKVEAGNYKVWVGAVDANGDVIDDGYAYFTVNEATSCDHQWSSRTGTCKLCGEECPHNNGVYEIETASKGVSISETEHRIVYTYDEECKICRYVLNADLTKEDTEKHSFDSNGDCVQCDYRAACKHTNTTYVVIEGYPAYHYYDEDKHTADTQFKEVCLDCDKVVQYPVDSERIYVHEAHEYDGFGKCTKCGYVKPEEQEELAISVSESTSTAEVGATIGATASATGGDGNYSYAWKVTCNGSAIADTDMSYGSYYSVTANEVGSYVFTAVVLDGNGNQKSASSGTISVTEPACKHPTTDVAWDTNYSITYKSISDTEHSMSGYMYEYCTECFEHIGDSYAATVNYGHDFDGAGDCPTCGYTKSCAHTDTKFVPIDGYPAYHQYDENEHIYDVQYKEVCTNASCGKTVRNLVDEQRVYEHQPHEFDENGQCYDCKYIKEEEQKPLEAIVARGQDTAVTGDLLTVSVSVTGGNGVYQYGWTVLLDGEELYQTDMSMDDEYSYTAEQAGSYVFVVTVEDSDGTKVTGSSEAIVVAEAACKHENTVEVTIETKYERESDAQHKRITVIGKVCDDCGTELSRFNREEYEEHSFENGFCSGCNLAEPTPVCTHVNGTESLISTTYASQGDTQQHVLLQTYATVCDDCGVTVGTREARVMEDHTFNENGVCGCGYAKPTLECDHARKVTELVGTPVYTKQDEKYHLIEAGYKTSCADCGITLSEGDSEISIETHTYVDGICACGQLEHVHDYEKVVMGKPTYTNQNTNEHSVTTTYYTKCSSCGDTTDQVSESRTEGHAYTDRGRIEAKHHAGQGHQTFNRCVCGAVEYTGYAPYKNCCECHGHQWGNAHEENGKWIKVCIKCGKVEETEPAVEIEQHVHDFKANTTVEPAMSKHPHVRLYKCECGEIQMLTTINPNCCECMGHDWADVVRLPDGSFKQGCYRCNEWQVVTPSKELVAYYEVLDMMAETQKNASKYQSDRRIDSHSSSIWKTVAGQATNKLTDAGFVYTTEALNTYSDMAGSIVGVFTQDSWDQQQIDLWESLLIQMLREQHQANGNITGIDEMNNFAKDTSSVTKVVEDFSKRSGKILSAQGQQISTSINEIDEWLLDLEQQANTLDRAGDYEGSNAIRNKLVKLRKLKNEYDESLTETQSSGKAASANEKNAKNIGLIMDIVSIVSEGTSSAQNVAQRNDAFADMIINGQNKVKVLESIVKTANATGNSNLAEAASKLKQELEDEIENQTNQFLSETGAFFSGILAASGEKAAEKGFDYLVDKAIEKGADTLAGVAGTAVKDSLAILGVIELGAKGLKSIVGWDKVYDKAQQLMTINQMDSTLGILQTLEEDDSQYMAELWALLQMKGCEQAQSFLIEWEDANWLTTEEFGIGKNELPTVIDQLDDEKQYYKNSLDLSFD